MKHHMLQLRLLKYNNTIYARKFGSGQPNQNYLLAFELYLAFVNFLILKQANRLWDVYCYSPGGPSRDVDMYVSSCCSLIG